MKALLWILSVIAVLSTGFLLFLSYAIWQSHSPIVGAHWLLFVLVLGLDVSCIGLWRINQRASVVAVPAESGERDGLRLLFILIAFVSGVPLLLLGAFLGLGFWANWAAERGAREFCDETLIGSDISLATARAENGKILWGASGGYYHNAPVGAGSPYTFYFFGFVMDKAVCEVSIDREDKVTSKHSEMEYD